jgi:outer membrane protein OmpA-like peptidoglycan-associated protein
MTIHSVQKPTAIAIATALALTLPLIAFADPADEAARKHFTQQNVGPAAMPGAGPADGAKLPDPTVSADAMVAFFTQDMPEDVTVAARRRHVDLDIKFDFDSAELSSHGIQQLDTAGQALSDPALESHRFMLAGHTDDVGNPSYNRELSRRRAESARKYLIDEHGISPERLETAGFGSDNPKDSGGTREARKRNRRVALELLD